MAYSNLNDLPRFHTFQDAVEYHKNTKGIRGRTNIIPLKLNRRDPDTYRIEAEIDSGGNYRSVSCYLYRTPVLIYTPDRLIVTPYCSMTTNSFIDGIAPHWLRAYMRNGQKFRVRGHGEFVAEYTGKLIVSVDGVYNPVKVEADKLINVVLNRTRAAEARKSMKPLIDLARATSKLDGYWDNLRNCTDKIEDPLLAHLHRLLQIWGVWRLTFDSLKQKIYIAEYDNQDCYDRAPAEYGVIPNRYEVTR